MEEELMLNGIDFDGGKLNMQLSGSPMHVFWAAFVEMFEAAGAENYLTTTIEHGKDRYEVTIRNCNGIKTPAEEINELRAEIEMLKRGE